MKPTKSKNNQLSMSKYAKYNWERTPSKSQRSSANTEQDSTFVPTSPNKGLSNSKRRPQSNSSSEDVKLQSRKVTMTQESPKHGKKFAPIPNKTAQEQNHPTVQIKAADIQCGAKREQPSVPPFDAPNTKKEPSTQDAYVETDEADPIYAQGMSSNNRSLRYTLPQQNRKVVLDKQRNAFDQIIFDRERQKAIYSLTRCIFRPDIELDLEELKVVDEKFLSGIDVTGYVDEVFNDWAPTQ